jgi:sulfopyruvate decarboxylase subunit alpha
VVSINELTRFSEFIRERGSAAGRRDPGLTMEAELAKRTVKGLKDSGINFITYLPETRMSEILPILQADKSFQLLSVASEAEAVSIAAGAALGGKGAAVYTDGNGPFVSAYHLLTVGIRYGIPLLLLVTYQGSFEDQRNTFVYVHYGTKMKALLEALGIEYKIIEDGKDLEARLKDAVRMTNALKLPVALLFTGEFTV